MSDMINLYESILLESAMEAMRDRFHQDHGLHPDVFNHLYHNALPENNKSLGDMEWLANREVKGENVAENHETVKHIMTEFAKPAIKSKLQKKKANQYKTFQDLHDAVAPHLGTAPTKKEKEEEGTETIYKSDTHIIKKHMTQESMVKAAFLPDKSPVRDKIGGEDGKCKATWCVSVEGDQGKNYFNSYTNRGQHPFYTIEHTAKHPTDPHRKFAVLADPNRDEMTHEVRDELQVGRMDLGVYAIKNQSILHTQPGQYISNMIGLSHIPKGISYKEKGGDVKIEKKEGGGYIKTRNVNSYNSFEHLNDNFDLHGPYETESLSYRKTGNYKDGKRHGEFTYSEKISGKTINRENWNEGKISEEKQFNSINGNLESHTKYDENERPIEKIDYHPNGNLKGHHFYDENGMREGKMFDENGNIKRTFTSKIRNGSYYRTKTLYREDGTKIDEENVKDGKLHGKQIYYHPNGNKATEENYMNHKLHGMARIYHENGNEKSSTPYRNGEIDGVVRERREDGSLISETEYSKGNKHGIKKTYHENGNVESEIPHVKGESHGIVRGYHENGNIKTEYEAYRGTVKGKFKVFREDGYLRYIKNHKTGGNIEYREFEDHEKVKDYDFENKKPIYESHNRFRKIIEGK